MLTSAQIEAITCDSLSRDDTMRRRVLGAVREYFSGHKPDFDPAMDDTDLMGYAKAKYHDQPFDAVTARASSEEAFRRFSCLRQVADYLCSWYKESLKARLPQAA